MDTSFAKIVNDEACPHRDKIMIDGRVFGLDVVLTERNNEIVAAIVHAFRNAGQKLVSQGVDKDTSSGIGELR